MKRRTELETEINFRGRRSASVGRRTKTRDYVHIRQRRRRDIVVESSGRFPHSSVMSGIVRGYPPLTELGVFMAGRATKMPRRWRFRYPNGISSFSPALRGTNYAGKRRPSPFNPEWVASDGIARDWCRRMDATPLGLETTLADLPR